MESVKWYLYGTHSTRCKLILGMNDHLIVENVTRMGIVGPGSYLKMAMARITTNTMASQNKGTLFS